MRACVIAEKVGVVAIAVVASGFMGQARAMARALGIPHVTIAEYPGVPLGDSDEELAEKIRVKVLPVVLAHLTTSGDTDADLADGGRTAVTEPEPEPEATYRSGSFDEIQDVFLREKWSDGLPVVPPTVDRIRRFLEFTDRDPHEVIAVLPPENREATVWNVAVTGVMAGCRPEYMPVLIAAVEAIADPEYGLQHGGSTPGWEPIVVLSGAIVDELGFNTDTGVMRVGTQANTSIGRFMRLYTRNIAGLRPGEFDKGSIGLGFNVAIAENETAVTGLGWPPYRIDRGFAMDDSVVTVMSVVAVSLPIYSAGPTAEERLESLVYCMRRAMDPWVTWGIYFAHWHPLLILGPDIARTLAAEGWTKDDVRMHLFREVRMKPHWLERYHFHVGGAEQPLAKMVAENGADPMYVESDDPERLVPMLLRPEWTDFIVAGDPGRNQSRLLINNHEQGVPVTRRIVQSADWKERRTPA
jgi:hypothetical protein